MSGKSSLLCIPKSIAASNQESSSGGGRGGLNIGQVLSFIHPRSGKPAQYLLSGNYQFCELQSFMPSGSKYGSWFVEQKVVQDGRLYVASPMDPKFLLLSVIEKHGTRYSPLEQILACQAGGENSGINNNYMPLRQCRRLELERICEVNDQLGNNCLLYRFDCNKTLAWLAKKVERTQAMLASLEAARQTNNGLGSGFVAGFIRTTTNSNTNRSSTTDNAVNPSPPAMTREHLKGAIEFVSDYLSDEWTQKLMEHFKMTEDEVKQSTKRPCPSSAAVASWGDEGPSEQDSAMEFTHGKRIKSSISMDSSANDGGKAKAGSSSQSMAQKKLAKTNLKGVKSIASFFGKKSS